MRLWSKMNLKNYLKSLNIINSKELIIKVIKICIFTEIRLKLTTIVHRKMKKIVLIKLEALKKLIIKLWNPVLISTYRYKKRQFLKWMVNLP